MHYTPPDAHKVRLDANLEDDQRRIHRKSAPGSARNLIHVYRPRLRCQPTPTEAMTDGAYRRSIIVVLPVLGYGYVVDTTL
jgi:hypothetical protein